MPLLPGSMTEVIAENVKELMRKGHDESQAVAIAMKEAGKPKKAGSDFKILGTKPGTEAEAPAASGGLGALAASAAQDRADRGVELEHFTHEDADPGAKGAHHMKDGRFYDDTGRELFHDEKSGMFFHHPKE